MPSLLHIADNRSLWAAITAEASGEVPNDAWASPELVGIVVIPVLHPNLLLIIKNYSNLQRNFVLLKNLKLFCFEFLDTVNSMPYLGPTSL